MVPQNHVFWTQASQNISTRRSGALAIRTRTAQVPESIRAGLEKENNPRIHAERCMKRFMDACVESSYSPPRVATGDTDPVGVDGGERLASGDGNAHGRRDVDRDAATKASVGTVHPS